MKKKAIAIAIATGALWVAGAAAANAGTENPQACFGQDRAAGVQGLRESGVAPGQGFASIRKGDNSSINAAYRDACQAAG